MKSITKIFLPGYLINCLVISIILQATNADNEKTEQKLLILGDSLSAVYGIKQGWVDLLQKAFKESRAYQLYSFLCICYNLSYYGKKRQKQTEVYQGSR